MRDKVPQRTESEFALFWSWDRQKVDLLSGNQFTGERLNDCHYSIAANRRARESAKQDR